MSLIKFVFVLISSSVLVSANGGQGAYYYNVQHIEKCKVESPVSLPTDWITMAHSCTNLMMQQVQKELNASLTYLEVRASKTYHRDLDSAAITNILTNGPIKLFFRPKDS
ncbi:uncharacterized protein LOC113469798 [Diaphorina citri]|uniref:Uncharacterized protein LOC113469798 n=1 Tax=Diaphorina citri TaxID=121845 RepID=A0A3Q0J4V3_DIACI|nr:uncharacterized protein LOC113469798 [Diaphorina citri]